MDTVHHALANNQKKRGGYKASQLQIDMLAAQTVVRRLIKGPIMLLRARVEVHGLQCAADLAKAIIQSLNILTPVDQIGTRVDRISIRGNIELSCANSHADWLEANPRADQKLNASLQTA